jgi:6-phosphogluconolactonase
VITHRAPGTSTDPNQEITAMTSIRSIRGLVLAAFALLTAFVVGAAPASAASSNTTDAPVGAVYAQSNDPAGNAIVVFDRAADGSLTVAGSFSTGGLGTGAGLGSQGSVVLSGGGRWLLAVNAGSDQITAFRVTNHGLVRTDIESSGGDQPISISIRGHLVYALNDGSDSLSGFRLTWQGDLKPIAGSTIGLSGAGISPAQVQFAPNGRRVVVTEKNTNLIDVYWVRPGGRLKKPNIQASEGETPFGFDFTPGGRLVVSEAVGGAPGQSTVSSYGLGSAGSLTTISASVPDGQSAACWVVITKDGRYAYTTNTGSGSVSGFAIADDGSLNLLGGAAAPAGTAPADLDAADGFLYTNNGGSDNISAFVINADGSLTPILGVGGLPIATVGLAVT